MTKEISNSALELTDEEVEKAAGGTRTCMKFTCKKCGKPNAVAWDKISTELPCQYCGYIYVIEGSN